MTEKLSADQIKRQVQEDYGKVATGCCNTSACCGGPTIKLTDLSNQLGYSQQELASVVTGANLGLGCGNPQAIAQLQPGETVLDLGSGGGFDCFLAATKVGKNGKVIGVDMTAEMIFKARENAKKQACENVEFRLGEIENLPVADNSVDVIISNCVINLSPNKTRVWQEAYRVLKSQGRLAISDVVLLQELPDNLKEEFAYYSACISGASYVNDLRQQLCQAGFSNIEIKPKEESKEFINNWAPGQNLTDYLVSATITAIK